MFDELKEAIRSKEAEKARDLLQEMEEKVATGDMEVTNGVTQPSEITELHNLLTEHLGVPPRTMMVKGRITSRRGRAMLFCKAMRIGLERVM